MEENGLRSHADDDGKCIYLSQGLYDIVMTAARSMEYVRKLCPRPLLSCELGYRSARMYPGNQRPHNPRLREAVDAVSQRLSRC